MARENVLPFQIVGLAAFIKNITIAIGEIDVPVQTELRSVRIAARPFGIYETAGIVVFSRYGARRIEQRRIAPKLATGESSIRFRRHPQSVALVQFGVGAPADTRLAPIVFAMTAVGIALSVAIECGCEQSPSERLFAIADPRGTHDPFAMVQMSDGTFSTSGDYERFFLKDGKRYHHILDPDFGEPATGCRSVTLVSNRAVMADAVAKGVFLLGPAEGMKLIETLPDIEGVIVSAQNEVAASSGLKGKIQILKPPTNAP